MNLFTKLMDIIYPPRCHVCQVFLSEDDPIKSTTASLFCQTCLTGFRKISPPLCSICGTPFSSETEDDHPCETCLRKRPHYEAARAPYLYEDTLMKAIHQFKYGAKSALADSLGPLLAHFAESWVREPGVLTMPVPLHPKRLRERGFNQSLLLARHVAKKLAAGLDFLSLRRVRHTPPQTALGSEERRKNVRGAFEVIDAEAVKGKVVLLIDDVATTGNTLNECARVLNKSGCKKVLCLTLARAANL
jgi:ComF family protein